MANARAKRAAATLLRLYKGVPGTRDAHIRAAARRVVAGQERAGDVDIVFRARGYSRSGRGQARVVRGFTDPLQNIAASAFIAGQQFENDPTGSRSVLSMAYMINTASREFERILQTKFVRKTAEEIGRKLGATRVGRGLGINAVSSSAALNRMVGALRVGGAALTGVTLGYEANTRAARVFQSEARGRQIRNEAVTAMLQAGFDPRFITEIEALSGARANAEYRGTPGTFNRIKEALGFGKSGGRLEFEARQISEEQKRRERGRMLAEELGVSEQALYAREANRRGISIDQLTATDRVRILDAAIRDKISPEDLAKEPHVRAIIEAKLDQEFMRGGVNYGGGDALDPLGMLGLSPGRRQDAINAVKDTFLKGFEFISGADFTTTDEAIEIRRQELLREHADKRLSLAEQKRQARLIAIEQHERLQVTVADRMRRQEGEEVARASFANRRSRHRPWFND